MKKIRTAKILGFLTLISSLNTNAALYDIGNGLIYDDGLNLTWLQDANYSQSSGFDSNGIMSWIQANEWASNLELSGAIDWRLPNFQENTPQTGYYRFESELGSLFYNTLGNTAGSSSIKNFGFYDPTSNTQMTFINASNKAFWMSDESQSGGEYFAFNTTNGRTNLPSGTASLHVWAVHDGNISDNSDLTTVPAPASAFLFGSALLGLIIKRRQTNP